MSSDNKLLAIGAAVATAIGGFFLYKRGQTPSTGTPDLSPHVPAGAVDHAGTSAAAVVNASPQAAIDPVYADALHKALTLAPISMRAGAVWAAKVRASPYSAPADLAALVAAGY